MNSENQQGGRPLGHFHTENANRRIEGILFEPYEIFAGTVLGIFATDDSALIEKLSQINGVTEIDAARYEACRKKKAPSLIGSVISNQASAQAPAAQAITVLKQADAAVAGRPSGLPQGPGGRPQGEELIVSVDDALKLEAVKPSEIAADSEATRKSKIANRK